MAKNHTFYFIFVLTALFISVCTNSKPNICNQILRRNLDFPARAITLSVEYKRHDICERMDRLIQDGYAQLISENCLTNKKSLEKVKAMTQMSKKMCKSISVQI